MTQIKIFNREIENKVNDWLKTHRDFEIVDIKHSLSLNETEFVTEVMVIYRMPDEYLKEGAQEAAGSALIPAT